MSQENETNMNSDSDSKLDLDLGISRGQELVRSIQNDNSSTNNLKNIASSSKQIKNMKQDFELDKNELDGKNIIHFGMSNKNLANVYREVRTKLLKISKGSNFTIMVSSVTDNYNISNISLNLASSFSFDETKTSLVVDCNIQEPFLHKVVDITPDSGLTDFLENQDIPLEDIIHTTGINRLRIIPVGTRREISTEYFTSQRMKSFINALRTRYTDRFIVLDCPPILENADSKILAELCDYIILVVPYGRVTKARLINATKSFDKQKLAGIIFSDEPGFH
jgi:Mrp family chromosome partitioning ATPase